MSEIRTFFTIEGKTGIYDLSSGYGGSDRIGIYGKMVPIYSAEGFLCAIEDMCETTDSDIIVRPVCISMEKVHRGRNYL